MSDEFFIPWKKSFSKGKEYRALTVKIQHSYKSDYFGLTRSQNVGWWKKPYFAITNESSTVKFFLDAVLKGVDNKEAEVYMSKDSKFALEDVKNLFSGMENFNYARKLSDRGKPDPPTVTISPCYDGKSRGSLIHVKMVYEPDRYGKWKIYKIEETDC